MLREFRGKRCSTLLEDKHDRLKTGFRVLVSGLRVCILDSMGIMEKKMETTTMGYIGIIGYMGGCQNYGPFLGPHYNTAPNI